MIDYVFKEIKGLEELEKNNQWSTVLKMLYELWINDKDNIDINFRLIGECWYGLVYSDCTIELFDDEWDLYKNTLIEATQYWLNNYEYIETYSSLIGYMISLFPYLFYECDECDEGHYYNLWEKIGADLINKSYEKYNNNHIVRLVYLGNANTNYNIKKEYKKEKSIVGNSINKYFTDNTEIEKYFIRIWGLK